MLLCQQKRRTDADCYALHVHVSKGQLEQHDMNKSKPSQDEHEFSIDNFKMCMACNTVGTQVARVSMRIACLKMSDDASNAILWA